MAAGVVAAAAAVAAYFTVWGGKWGLDLHVYRDGIHDWLGGHDPYRGIFTAYDLPYTYPPASLPVLSVLDAGPFSVVRALVWAAGVVEMAVASYLVAGAGTAPTVPPGASAPGASAPDGSARLSRRGVAARCALWACVAALVVEPARSNLDYGQVDALLMLLVVTDLVAVPRRHRGWLLGLAGAVKLTPLVFLLVLFWERDWRSMARCLAAFVAADVVMLAAWPTTSLRFWGHALWHVGRIGPVAFTSNQSWNGVVHRLLPAGPGRTVAWLALSLLTVAVASAVAWPCLHQGRRVPAIFAVALCGLLASPISWTHEWVWVVLVPPLLLGRYRSQVPPPVRTMLWVLLALSVTAPYWWFHGGAPAQLADDLMPLWALACLAVWAELEWRPLRRQPTVAPGPSATPDPVR